LIEYRVIDRFQRTMSISTNQQGVPPTRVVAATETDESSLLSSCVLPLAQLLEVGDEWGEFH
jgi:hypothetical protein